jgi:hypothetical protein
MLSMNSYAQALSVLRNLLPEEATLEFEVLETRMMENLQRERLYGSNPSRSAERFEIVDGLNQLAWKYQAKSFTELCFHPQTVNVETSAEPSTSTTNVVSGSKKVALPKVDVKFFTHILPTAYYHMIGVQDFPFFQITIDNSSPDGDDSSLVVSALIEDHSYLENRTVAVARGKSSVVRLLPTLKHSALITLTDMRKVKLQISVKQISPSTEDIENRSETVQLMARNEALIAVRDEEQHVVDLTKYLAAWVTPNHPEISRILRLADEFHSETGFSAYQKGETTEETAASVREQVQAIFLALKYKTELIYASTNLQWDIRPGWITQKVRLPGECLEQGALANCLDGAVLFASLLERIGIEPLLVLVPGHAFIGWRVERGVDQYEFLDTTMIGVSDFEQAQAHASKLYNQAVEHNDFSRELFHQFGFARRIDVVQCRRGDSNSQGIYPLV